MGLQFKAAFSEHVVLVGFPGWGHLRPLAAFACKIVQERPDIAVTFLTAGGFGKRVAQEISRYFSATEQKSKENIRLVNLGGQGFEPFGLVPVYSEAFPGYYKKIVNCEPVQCTTGETYGEIRRPDVVIVDFFFLEILHTVRSVSGKTVPVFAWAPANASATLRMIGPERFGGLGDVVAKARAQAKTTGRTVEDIAEELYRPSKGSVVAVSGLPPMYDYEWSPQEATPEIPQNQLFDMAYNFAMQCDGFVSATSPIYEPESAEAIRTWLSETNRPTYFVGPLVPRGADNSGFSDIAKQKELDLSENGSDFRTFLDNALRRHGEKSLIYVSFGSVWWPNSEHVWIFVSALLDLGFPFILSHASPKAIIPPELAQRIKESGFGLLSAWSPQQTILNHPATGWILTHCGQNSVTEALAQGIPMIAWPIDADQPANAAYLTLTLDVAFEMIEVRTGYGRKPLYRGVQPAGTVEAVAAEARSILKKASGLEGMKKRQNAENLRDKLKGEWEEGGGALRNLQRFLADIPPQDPLRN